MSFQIDLWQFSKPVNSTAIPSSAAKSYACTANDNLSVVAPVIKIAEPITTDMSIYNYAYIASFHRYYWINDLVYDRGLWVISMSVDPLASWKTEIGALSPYVLRAAAAYDGAILDTFYPSKNSFTVKRVTASSPWEYGGVTDGCYSVGIVSSGGITDFWIMSRSELANLLTFMFSDQFAEDMIGVLSNVSPEAKAIADPLQYIASVTWLPISLPATFLTAIKVGYSTIPINCAYGNPSVPYSITLSFTRPSHDQAASRGSYMNGSPYSQYSIFIPPFGRIDLDGSVVMSSSTITANIYLDRCQGNGTLEVLAGSTVICRVGGKIGMPVQLSQVIAPGFGLMSGLSAVAGAATSALSGNWGGLAAGIASGISDAVKSQIPSVNTVGSVGSCDTLLGTPALQMTCAEVVDDDISSRGRPLCQVRQISNLSGFIQCVDVEVNIGCTEAEHQQIKAYMERGFFYA